METYVVTYYGVPERMYQTMYIQIENEFEENIADIFLTYKPPMLGYTLLHQARLSPAVAQRLIAQGPLHLLQWQPEDVNGDAAIDGGNLDHLRMDINDFEEEPEEDND